MTELTPKLLPPPDLAPDLAPEDRCPGLSYGTRRALAALRRDLPGLLADRRARGKNVCYHLEERLGISSDYLSLVRECVRRGLPEDEWIVMTIQPGAGQEVYDL